jgi:hypothetical protein
VGIALNARRIASDYRTYVLLGDGESAEGSVWEAAQVAAFHKARQPVRHHRRERIRPEPGDAVGPPTLKSTRRGGTRSAGTRSASTAMT